MNSKITKIALSIIIVCVFGVSQAQQEPNYMLYRYVMNIINPAYAGSESNYSLTTNIRSQWVNVEGALKTQSFFYEQPVGDRIGVGLSVVNDEVFIENQTTVNLDVSYRVQLFDKTDLLFGIKAGGGTYSLDTSRIISSSNQIDPVINNFDDAFKLNIGMGFYLKHEKYFLSFSVPSLFSNRRIQEARGIATQATEESHIYLSGGYNFKINDQIEFRPSFMMRYISTIPLSTDFTAAFRFFNKFEVAGSYRTDQALSGFVMINLSDWMDLGYAYDTSIRSELSNITDGTHEILLRINFMKSDNRRRY